MSQPIDTMEELENTLALGLDFWTVVVSGNYPRTAADPFLLKSPKFHRGARGKQLGNAIINPTYLVRCGIQDSDNHHSITTYGRSLMMLFHTQQAAIAYRDRINKK